MTLYNQIETGGALTKLFMIKMQGGKQEGKKSEPPEYLCIATLDDGYMELGRANAGLLRVPNFQLCTQKVSFSFFKKRKSFFKSLL